MIQNNIYDVDGLLTAIQNGFRAKYVFFWSHRPEDQIGKQCFSQWYSASFTIDNVEYPTTEHFMMAEKARLFQDDEILARILIAKHPGEAKKLGRMVARFNKEVWLQNCFEIVTRGNTAKFSQNQLLGDFLLKTQNRILVEASPLDPIWGIGLAEDNSDIYYPEKWRGCNLLGFALMKVRQRLNAEKQIEI